jgi:hypothetical protein
MTIRPLADGSWYLSGTPWADQQYGKAAIGNGTRSRGCQENPQDLLSPPGEPPPSSRVNGHAPHRWKGDSWIRAFNF